MIVYPNAKRALADERAQAALNCIEGEVMIIRRRIAEGADADHDTKILTDAVRRLTHNLAVLGTLREWRAAHEAAKDGG